jgi:hypothetical protein
VLWIRFDADPGLDLIFHFDADPDPDPDPDPIPSFTHVENKIKIFDLHS